MKLPDGWIFRVKPNGVTQIEIVQDELVLCKNCKHYYVLRDIYGRDHGFCKESMARRTEPDEFCSREEGDS